MTRIRVFAGGALVPATDIDSALADATARGGTAWVDVTASEEKELDALAARFSWPHRVSADARRSAPKRARLEHTDEETVMVLLPARYVDATETVELASLMIIAREHLIVTVRAAPWIDADGVEELIRIHPSLGEGPEVVMWALCANVTAGYSPVVEGVEEDIDEIEEQLFDPDTDVSRRIFALQRELIRMEHATDPVPEMLDDLAATQPADHAELAVRLRSSSDAAEHVHGRVDGFRQTLDNALTVHATLVGEQSNAEMKRMTEFSLQQNEQVKKISSWAAIGFAPSLLAGIYGMNFRTMPELHWAWGYPFALALMVGVGGALYAVFKRHDWL